MPHAVRRGRRSEVKGGFEHSEGVEFTWSQETERRPARHGCQGSREVKSTVPVLRHVKKKGP